MSSNLIEKINNHIEFLGYTIEKHELQQADFNEYFRASHSILPSLVYFELPQDFVSFQVRFTTEKSHTIEMDSYINKVNAILRINKAYVNSSPDGQTTIHLDAVYNGEYTKPTFATFYELFEADIRLLSSLDNWEQIFIK